MGQDHLVAVLLEQKAKIAELPNLTPAEYERMLDRSRRNLEAIPGPSSRSGGR